jgi:hypothetical protein
LLIIAAAMGFQVTVILYMQHALGFRPAAAGLGLFPTAAVIAAVSFGLSARLIGRLGRRPGARSSSQPDTQTMNKRRRADEHRVAGAVGLRRAGQRGMAARRAVIRWAWRLFRREWRQQLLVLALITVAVAVTIVGSAVAIDNVPPGNSGFGTADDMATFTGNGPHLAAQIASLEHRFGRVDVIENQTEQVPGSASIYQLRAQNPGGPTSGSELRTRPRTR